MVIGAVIFLFSSIGTSTIFPLSMGVAFYFVGESTEEILIFLKGPGAAHLHPFFKSAVGCIDYIFLNLSALDLKAAAIYGLPVKAVDLFYVSISALAYISILLVLSVLLFKKREFL